MILPFILSDGDFAMSELGDLADMTFGMMYLLLLLGLMILMGLVILITVRGCAGLIRRAHVHAPGMFT
jgi:hypothetical protein